MGAWQSANIPGPAPRNRTILRICELFETLDCSRECGLQGAAVDHTLVSNGRRSCTS